MKSNAIKRHQYLVSFSRDHHFGLLLVWKIRQGLKLNVEPERISNYSIFFFENDLRDHFKKEEEGLFSKLDVNDPLRKQAFEDHTTILQLIGQLTQHRSNIEILNQFADKLENHIRFEERILFNHLQDTLPEEELIKGLESHAGQECKVDDEWKDHFWVTKNR